jgi:hypothetical protein
LPGSLGAAPPAYMQASTAQAATRPATHTPGQRSAGLLVLLELVDLVLTGRAHSRTSSRPPGGPGKATAPNSPRRRSSLPLEPGKSRYSVTFLTARSASYRLSARLRRHRSSSGSSADWAHQMETGINRGRSGSVIENLAAADMTVMSWSWLLST